MLIKESNQIDASRIFILIIKIVIAITIDRLVIKMI